MISRVLAHRTCGFDPMIWIVGCLAEKSKRIPWRLSDFDEVEIQGSESWSEVGALCGFLYHRG